MKKSDISFQAGGIRGKAQCSSLIPPPVNMKSVFNASSSTLVVPEAGLCLICVERKSAMKCFASMRTLKAVPFLQMESVRNANASTLVSPGAEKYPHYVTRRYADLTACVHMLKNAESGEMLDHSLNYMRSEVRCASAVHLTVLISVCAVLPGNIPIIWHAYT